MTPRTPPRQSLIPPPRPSPSVGADERAASEILGTMLAFALVVSLVVLMQVSLVPVWNHSAEFEHSQGVTESFVALDESATRVAMVGTSESVAVDLGVTYPSRFVFINPPAATGSLRSTPPAAIELRHVVATDVDVADYWDGSAQTFTTQSLVFQTDYRELQDEPEAHYESGVLYRTFANGNVVVDRNGLIDGNQITLVTFEGDVARNGVDPSTVELQPLSAPARRVDVTDNGNEIELVVPTTLTAQQWRTAVLADEIADGNVSDVVASPGDSVVVRLDRGSYELRLARVGLSAEPTPTSAHYLVDVSGTSRALAVGETTPLIVEARDTFNNPVGDVDVVFTNASTGTVLDTLQSDADGRAAFQYTGTGDTTNVRAHIGSGAHARERVDFTLTSTAGYPDVGLLINPSWPGSVRLVGATPEVNGNKWDYIEMTFENTGNTRDVTRARVSFVSHVPPGSSSDPSTPAVTLYFDSDTTLNKDQSFAVGDDYTAVTETARLYSGQTMQIRVSPSNLQFQSGDYLVLSFQFDDGSKSTYFVSPDDGSTSTNNGGGNNKNKALLAPV